MISCFDVNTARNADRTDKSGNGAKNSLCSILLLLLEFIFPFSFHSSVFFSNSHFIYSIGCFIYIISYHICYLLKSKGNKIIRNGLISTVKYFLRLHHLSKLETFFNTKLLTNNIFH